MNQGFDRLRQYVRLPGLSKKKLSKVDTLRAAAVYIGHLQSLLAHTDTSPPPPPHHFDEQLLPLPHYHHQQQQPDADDATTSPADPGFLFMSLLQTAGAGSPTYDVTAATSGPPEPCVTYSTVPPVDVNDNDLYGELVVCPPAWSQGGDGVEQERRVGELTAWLMQ